MPSSSSSTQLSVLVTPHIVDAVRFLQQNLTRDNLTLDNAKNAVVFYLVFSRVLKLYRHVRARGVRDVAGDMFHWIAEVRVLRVLRSQT